MRSASAKLRASRAARRASISRSISSTRHGRPLVLGAAQRQHAEHPVEPVERGAHAAASAAPQLAGVDRRVERAHQIEHDADPGRGIEVGGDVLGERGARPPRSRVAIAGCASPAGTVVEPRQEVGQPLERLPPPAPSRSTRTSAACDSATPRYR